MKPPLEHLYIHIPFCSHICPYCSFYIQKNHLPDIQAFIPALRKEILWARENFDLQLKTIYFGGGTPSVLSVNQLRELFFDWDFPPVQEFSIECNPATITPDKARFFADLGVNRISLGVQSFDEQFLKLLGRKHTREQVRSTIQLLQQNGFDNINIDLMFALPKQTLEHWQVTLEEAVQLGIQHVSAYNLTFEEDTSFFKRLRQGEWQLDQELQKDMFIHTRQFLAQHHFDPYEISNFATPQRQSLHNRGYWQGKDYLGLGPSATSTVGNLRWQNIPDTKRYIQSTNTYEQPERIDEPLSEQTKLTEKIFLGLRTSQGVPADLLTPWQALMDDLVHDGLAILTPSHLQLTLEGLLRADTISELFFKSAIH